MSNKQQFEREFESFLNAEDSRLAALYRKLPRPEPDAKLDAAVLAMARRAQASSQSARSRTPRWIPALSAAAVIALAVGIGVRIGPTVWHERDVDALQKTTNENAVPAAAAASAAKEQAQDTDAFKDKAAAKPASEPTSNPVATPAAPAAQALPPTGYAAPARPEARGQLRKVEAAARSDAPTPQAFPAQTPIEQEKKAAELDAAAARDVTSGQARNTVTERTADRKRDEHAQPASAAGLPMREESAPTPMSVPTTAAPPPARAAQTASPALQGPAAGAAPAESMLAAPAPAAKAAPKPQLLSQDPNAHLYPEHWLENIHTMLRENRREEALRSLAEFRRMYPDYHLPHDLRDLK